MDDVPRVRGVRARRAPRARSVTASSGGSAPVAAQPLLERLAAHVLHGDVRGAVRGCRGRTRPTMLGWLRLAAACASMRKRSTNSSSGGEPRLQHLDGHEAAEALVLGEIDVGHPAAARADETMRYRSASMVGTEAASVAFVIVGRVAAVAGARRSATVRRRRRASPRSVRCSSVNDGARGCRPRAVCRRWSRVNGCRRAVPPQPPSAGLPLRPASAGPRARPSRTR